MIFCSEGNNKRSRSSVDGAFHQQEQHSSSELIDRLRSENTSLKSQVLEMKTDCDKAIHENKILKKLVAHQHNQTSSELDEARKYRHEAEDKMRRMEQLIETLRYHLQHAQGQTNFMGFQPRPPDVF